MKLNKEDLDKLIKIESKYAPILKNLCNYAVFQANAPKIEIRKGYTFSQDAILLHSGFTNSIIHYELLYNDQVIIARQFNLIQQDMFTKYEDAITTIEEQFITFILTNLILYKAISISDWKELQEYRGRYGYLPKN